MRFTPRNLVLGGLVLALALATLLLEPPRLTGAADGPLFEAFDRALVTRISIEAPGGAPGQGVVLEKRAGTWTVAERAGFPAHSWAVEDLLGKVSRLRTGELAGEESSSHRRFGVDGAGRRLVLSSAGGSVLAAFVQGVPPDSEAGGLPEAARATYVRPANTDAVYRSPGMALVETAPLAWLDPTLLRSSPSEVRRLAVSWEGSPDRRLACELVRQADGTWLALPRGEGPPVPGSLVQAVLDAAAAILLSDVERRGLEPADGFAPRPGLSLALEDDEGGQETLWVGASSDTQERLVTRPDWEEPWVVRVPEAGVAQLLRELRAIERLLGVETLAVEGE